MMLRHLAHLTLAAALLATAGVAASEVGRIKRVYGDAKVRRGTAVIPATSGQVLEERDVLETGKDGRISLAFIDNTRFSIGPKSRVSVAEFKFDETTHRGGRFTAQVDRGTVAVVSGQIAKEGKDAMRVRTPTSLLGVRGTRFVVDVE